MIVGWSSSDNLQWMLSMRRIETYDDGLMRLSQLNRYEDIFDVFINIIIKRSPTIFILINMTLMIWMVQIIFSSRLDNIPRSTYFYSQFLEARPMLDLQMVSEMEWCPKDYSTVSLKPFPKIKNENITGLNLTHWEQKDIKFCAQLTDQIYNFTRKCDPAETYCSGFCVSQPQQCPITAIKRLHSNQPLPNNYEQFYATADGLWKYAFAKNAKKTFVTGLTIAYQKKCANDFALYDRYDSFEEYWNNSKDCGEEGTIKNGYFNQIDQLDVGELLINNGIWSEKIENQVGDEDAILGYMTVINFPNNPKCQSAQKKARNIQQYLVTPTFTQSLLVMCFIFFTGSWAWLIGFYCFETKRREKNIVVILMSIIELIVVVFSYIQNHEMFYTESVMQDISFCIQDQVQAARHWQFGVQSSSPFISIMFCCCSFLMLQLIANAIDMYMYDAHFEPRLVEVENQMREDHLPLELESNIFD